METNAFCTRCRKMTKHTIRPTASGEVDFVCTVDGHFFRVPNGTPAEIKAAVDAHNKQAQAQAKRIAAVGPAAEDRLEAMIASGLF